jgi:HlyD family secretion protein
MDRPLPEEYKRRNRLRQVFILSGVVLLLVTVVIFLKNVFVPGVSLSRVTVARAERGSIQITVQGSGTVIPSYEEIISAPFKSNLVRIIRKPGEKVKPSDTLLILDNKLAANDLDMLRNEYSLENIRIEKLKIDLKQLQEDYEFSRKIKDIKVENARLAYEAEAELNKLGGSPSYNVQKAKTEWEIEQLESGQAQYNFNNQVNARKNGIHELETEISIQNNKIVKARDLVDKAYVKAPFSGDLSWIIDQPGASVNEGQQIARVADFSGYKLKGALSNSWSGMVMAGQKVEVRNQGIVITGEIENIMPAVNQGMLECIIKLVSGNISSLRQAQQLEIRVIISFRDNVLRLPNGPYYKDRGYKYLYVVRGNRAYRTKVLLGDSNFDFVEVQDGLKEGDNVIITDIESKFTNGEIAVSK